MISEIEEAETTMNPVKGNLPAKPNPLPTSFSDNWPQRAVLLTHSRVNRESVDGDGVAVAGEMLLFRSVLGLTSLWILCK